MRLEKFLFCESVRQEVSGQQTLVGVFPTDMVSLSGSGPENAPFILPSLAIVAVLDQLVGINSIRVQCEVKFGNETIQKTPGIVMERAQPRDPHHTLNIAFAPFPCPGFGEYLFKLTVEAGGETASFSRRLMIERFATPIPAPSQRH